MPIPWHNYQDYWVYTFKFKTDQFNAAVHPDTNLLAQWDASLGMTADGRTPLYVQKGPDYYTQAVEQDDEAFGQAVQARIRQLYPKITG